MDGDLSESAMILQPMLGDHQLVERVKTAKVLLVGGGGIGCEVLKNLLLVGFSHVKVVDLDTIDVSNLNRQFLFNKSHVGRSKADIASRVAKENFAHDLTVDVESIHDSIQKPLFDVDFFKSHNLVINALDNRAARSHVNRMCLAADVPLIESGSEGYLGQVFLIKKDVTACYDCEGPRKDQVTYAACTIRNTPSQPIHCIVWGKYLFAQLFGEEDADNDVSPDINDPELASTGETKNGEDQELNVKRQSTRQLAEANDYEPKLLFERLFKLDIDYLLKMDQLWETRRKPTPLNYDDVLNNVYLNGSKAFECSSSSSGRGEGAEVSLKDQKLWTLKECLEHFSRTVSELHKRMSTENYLVWDKDDALALDFVTAVSNLRSHIFGIERKSKFDVKSMAGNIIPAISSTNSIVGGLITLQAINILRNQPEPSVPKEEVKQFYQNTCKHAIIRKVALDSKVPLISSYPLAEANPKCLVCCAAPEVEVILSFEETLVNDFVEKIILGQLNFVCPDIYLDDILLWSKDDFDEQSDEEKEQFKNKRLKDWPKVTDKARIKVFDLIQNYTIIITLKNMRIEPNDNEGQFYKMVFKEN